MFLNCASFFLFTTQQDCSFCLLLGHSITPMRKLIMKMEDMAEIVCNQCLQGNGKKKDDDNFSVSEKCSF